MIDKLLALYWDFLQIPYYKVFVTKDKKVVKIFNQRAVTNQDGSDIALIDKSSKMAWWINKDHLVHKSRFMFFVDIKNALPLVISTSEKTTEILNGLVIKEVKKVVLKIDKKKKNKTEEKTGDILTGKPYELVEIAYPSTRFYQDIEAHFVNKILAKPRSKWEELAPVLIVIVIIVGLLLWQYVTSKGASLT